MKEWKPAFLYRDYDTYLNFVDVLNLFRRK